MTSSARNPEVGIIVRARDQASAMFDRLNQSSGKLGAGFRRLIGIVSRLNVGFLALTAVVPIVGAAIAGMIGAATAISFLSMERSLRRARVQLQLFGMSSTEARDQLQTLTSLMDRAAVTSILDSAEAMNIVALETDSLLKFILPLSEKFANIISASPAEVFIALFDALAKHDPTKFQNLIVGMGEIAIPLEILDQLDANFAQPFVDWLVNITETETLTGLEKLATNLERIAMITQPTRESILSGVAATLNIFLESLATRLEQAQDKIGFAIQAMLLGAVANQIWAFVGRGLGRSLAVGIMVGLTTLFLSNLTNVVKDIFENPAIMATIAALAFTLGRWMGGLRGGLLGGLIFVIGAELLPGLGVVFGDFSKSTQVSVIAGGLGTALGLAMNLRIFAALTIGFVISEAFKILVSGRTLVDKALILTLGVVGGAIGFFWGRQVGAAIGASIGIWIGESIENATTRKQWVNFGSAIGEWLVFGVMQIFVTLPTLLAQQLAEGLNLMIKDINKFLPKFFDIPSVPVPIAIPPSIPTTGAPTVFEPAPFLAPQPQTFGTINGITQFEEDFAHGGIVPGIKGAPRRIIAHGGERITPPGQGELIIVQLILDKRVIGEVAIDAIHKTAKFNAGMVSGSIGS